MKLLLLSIAIFSCIGVNAQFAFQLFDENAMEYKGNKQTQAKLLLRDVKIWGKVSQEEPKIDTTFLNLLAKPIPFTKTEVLNYLTKNNINLNSIGGSIDNPVSYTTISNKKIYAKYFVIHDVSTPAIDGKHPIDFPKDIDDSTFFYKKQYWNKISKWKYNKLIKEQEPPSHIILTRTGESNTLVDFSEGWRATKFESKILKEKSKGLYLHIELVQPRVYIPPKSNKDNAPFAPVPGFADLQYKKLALLYVCASVRKGEWLVPAFHVCIDQEVTFMENGKLRKDSHDDPQNFELHKFTNEILKLISVLKIQ
jgi:hypothetical protein